MTARFQKFIRTISNGERSRSGAPASYTYCEGPSETQPRSDRAGGEQALGYTPQQQMNILHKATNSLLPGDKGKHKEHGVSHDKRKSAQAGLPGLHLNHGHQSRSHSPKVEYKPTTEFEVEMESPPLIMYGTSSNSTGALMSGQFKMRVTDPNGVRLEQIDLQLVLEQVVSKPVVGGCPQCTVHKNVVRHWKFLTGEAFYKQGLHRFPFSHLIVGWLPATTDTALGTIRYILYGHATPASPLRNSMSSHGSTTSSGLTTNGPTTNGHANTHQTHPPAIAITTGPTTNGHANTLPQPPLHSNPHSPLPNESPFVQELLVGRALPEPENDRTAVRVFPPTNLQAICTLPGIIHPVTNGFTVQLRLTGVAEHADMGKTVRNWKLKKLSWRLEEHTKCTSTACDPHQPRIGGSEQNRKGIVHEDMRVLGGKEQREGWKSDYTPPALSEKKGSGSIEMEILCGPKPRGKDDPRPACDVDTANGFSVHHKLVIECVVTEEMHPIDKPKWSAPTGVARILRMGFEIKVTERMGMGISWDEEQPPMYEDVPESPPGYAKGLGAQLGDDLVLLPDSLQAVPKRTDIEDWEEPPSYVDNRETIADDEEWDAHRVDFSEGVRPYPAGRSGSRGWSATGAGEGPSGSSEMRSPNVRPTRLDATDFETNPYSDMMRGRDREREAETEVPRDRNDD